MKHRHTPLVSQLTIMGLLVVLTDAYAIRAEERPVAVVDGGVSGHVHPSICQAKDGTLIVVYRGKDVLMCARSTDGGGTWARPLAIAASAKRPAVIREVKRFEVYPGTADTLPDGRVLVTWNYIADDKAKDGYYQRALLYTISTDGGRTFGEQRLIGPVDGKHLGAVRHNVLPWGEGRWLLPLREGPPRVFDPKSGDLSDYPLAEPGGRRYAFQQIIRTAKGTLLAMGPELLRSTDDGRRWSAVKEFPTAKGSDNLEGRYLTALADGRVIMTFGVGHDNKGLRYTASSDDGQTWNAKPIVLLPETNVAARYYSARTIQLDDDHLGTVFMNRQGVYYLKVAIDRVAKLPR